MLGLRNILIIQTWVVSLWSNIYIYLSQIQSSIHNSCFIIHIQTQLILVSSGATCYSIGNLFMDLGPTFLLSVQPQYFRVDDDHEYDNGKKINLLIMFTCQRQINLSKKIKAVSQYFDVDQDTERKLKRCERSQDPDLKQSFCSLLVNMYSSHSFAGGNSAILRHLCKISAANVTKNFALSAFTTWSVFFLLQKSVAIYALSLSMFQNNGNLGDEKYLSKCTSVLFSE